MHGARPSTCGLSGHTKKNAVFDALILDPVPILYGIPQGSILSPIFFLQVFVTDLHVPDKIRFSVYLLVDDFDLYRNIYNNKIFRTIRINDKMKH